MSLLSVLFRNIASLRHLWRTVKGDPISIRMWYFPSSSDSGGQESMALLMALFMVYLQVSIEVLCFELVSILRIRALLCNLPTLKRYEHILCGERESVCLCEREMNQRVYEARGRYVPHTAQEVHSPLPYIERERDRREKREGTYVQ